MKKITIKSGDCKKIEKYYFTWADNKKPVMSMCNISHDNILNILSFLTPRDIVSTRGICKYFFNIPRCEYLWMSVNFGQFGTNKMSNVIRVLRSIFGAKKVSMTDRIIIPKSVTHFTDSDFDDVGDLFPNVKHFTLSVDVPSGQNLAEDYVDRFSMRSAVSSRVLQVIQSWPLETVQLLGHGVFNVNQDYFAHIFRSLPRLRKFRCDFDFVNNKSWKDPGSTNPAELDLKFYGSLGIVSSALNCCKDLDTLHVPSVILRSYVVDSLIRNGVGNLRHFAVTLQKFRSASLAKELAESLRTVETLQIGFCWGSDLSHVDTFIENLPCVREITMGISDMLNYMCINIRSKTLKNIKFVHTKDPRYRPYLENIGFECSELETIEFNSMELVGVNFNDMQSLTSVTFNDCRCQRNFNLDGFKSDYPDVKVTMVDCD